MPCLDKNKNKEYQKQYHESHRAETKIWRDHYRCKNKEKLKKYGKNYRKRNKKKIIERHRNYYRKNKKRLAEQMKRRYINKRIWFDDYKKSLKCSICGENHWACIEFHHRNPSDKKYGIADMVAAGLDKNIILKEIEKCEILCSNCHRKLHSVPEIKI